MKIFLPTQLIVLLVCAQSSISWAQFLFSYEINQDDDSRAPKSSLFDPSSFKIVTPSQLQSSYQKISSQLESTAAATGRQQQQPAEQLVTPEAISNLDLAQVQQQQQQQPSRQQQQLTEQKQANQQPSLLKQTSAALQSFAELFSLSPSSSPAPLGSSAISPQPVDQQAEARSLHEHWTQQQQRSHQPNQQQQIAAMLQMQQQQLQQHQQSSILANTVANNNQQLTNSALNSFTTVPTASHTHLHNQQQQQQQQTHGYQPQQSQASYWLTASPMKPTPDGNFLVQINKQPQRDSQQQQLHHPISLGQAPLHHQTSSLVDNLLAIGHRATGGSSQGHLRSLPKPNIGNLQPTSSSNLSNLAQSSFLSTPTSYYPAPSGHSRTPEVGSLPPVTQPMVAAAPRPANHHHHQSNFFSSPQPQPQTSPVSSSSLSTEPLASANVNGPRLPSSSNSFIHTTIPTTLIKQRDLTEVTQQLRPPANLPDNFANTPSAAIVQPLHKSAEETLISYRQQQQQQHQHHQQHQPTTGSFETSGVENGSHQHQHQHQFSGSSSNNLQNNAQQQQPSIQRPIVSNDIPKVSPQIYESFLLQQKDQHEKHMELLKQQQELNKLLEQKQKQQKNEEDSKRKRKKDELDKEARKKALRDQEQAQKLKLEQEERERDMMRRRREEEEERKRFAEEQRYRELLEAREREIRLRKQMEEERENKLLLEREREAQLAKLRRREEEERALKLRLEREREELEQAERRRQAEAEEAAAAELKRKQEKEAEEARQQRTRYLAQQEELKKLLELKQKEDEATQLTRRRQALQQQQQQQQSGGRSGLQTARVNRIVAELRERTGAQTWGTPLRNRGPTTEAPAQSQLATGTISTAPLTTTTTTTTSAPATSESYGSSGGRSRASYDRDPPAASPSPSTAQSERSLFKSARERIVLKKQRIERIRNGNNTTQSAYDEKLIRQNIPLYSGPGKYGLYRSGNDSISSDLAALLDSVSLPPSTSTTTSTTTTTTSTTTTQAPYADEDSRHSGSTSGYSNGDSSYYSSSLSPLLQRDSMPTPSERPAHSSSSSFSNEPVFDDDVPRRPARGLPRPSASSSSSSSSSLATGSLTGSGSTTQQQQTLTHRRGELTVGRFANESTPIVAPAPSGNSRTAHIGLASLPADSDNDGIPGRAGVEYPVLSSVPPTSFSCSKQPLNGYYADTETACQVVHLCQGGAQSSILCPNGTIFNQEKFSCQWWYEVNCSRAPNFYQLNDNLYKSNLPSGDDTNDNDDPKRDNNNNSNNNKRRGDKAEIGGSRVTRKEKSSRASNLVAS